MTTAISCGTSMTDWRDKFITTGLHHVLESDRWVSADGVPVADLDDDAWVMNHMLGHHANNARALLMAKKFYSLTREDRDAYCTKLLMFYNDSCRYDGQYISVPDWEGFEALFAGLEKES